MSRTMKYSGVLSTPYFVDVNVYIKGGGESEEIPVTGKDGDPDRG